LKAPYNPCIECKIFPIKKNRYECMNCENINLCEKCFIKHPKNHILIKLKNVNDKIKFNWVYNPEKVNQVLCFSCEKKISNSPLFQKKNLSDIIYCQDCFNFDLNDFWVLKYPPEELYEDNQIGKNPRGAYCDVKLDGCLISCTGIIGSALFVMVRIIKIGFDVCENCLMKEGHDEHGLIMIYHCKFPIYHKYTWTGHF